MDRKYILAMLIATTLSSVATAAMLGYFLFAHPHVEVRGIVSGNMDVSGDPYGKPVRVVIERD